MPLAEQQSLRLRHRRDLETGKATQSGQGFQSFHPQQLGLCGRDITYATCVNWVDLGDGLAQSVGVWPLSVKIDGILKM